MIDHFKDISNVIANVNRAWIKVLRASGFLNDGNQTTILTAVAEEIENPTIHGEL